jgi:hypothetical protein
MSLSVIVVSQCEVQDIKKAVLLDEFTEINEHWPKLFGL